MALKKLDKTSLRTVPSASSDIVRRQMKGNRGRDTKPELAMRRALRDAGLIGYRLHWRIGRCQVDIAFVRWRLGILVQGCFWHSCPKCKISRPKTNAGYWKRKLLRNQSRDKRQLTELSKAGWRIVSLWECEIRQDIGNCISKVEPILHALKHVRPEKE